MITVTQTYQCDFGPEIETVTGTMPQSKLPSGWLTVVLTIGNQQVATYLACPLHQTLGVVYVVPQPDTQPSNPDPVVVTPQLTGGANP